MNLLLLSPSEAADLARVALAGPRANHLRCVLRVEIGHAVRIGILDGPIGIGTVTAITNDHVELRCAFAPAPPERPSVDVLLALPRPKVLRRLWAQLSAIGVGRIILTNAERVERHYFDTHILEPETYRPLLIEGLQQARDTRVPLVSIHKQFRKLIEDDLDALVGVDGARIVAHPDPSAVTIGETARRTADRRVLLAVGPEGGWNTFELELLQAHGFAGASLGPRTLRTDTACVALLSVLHEARRGLRQVSPAKADTADSSVDVSDRR